MAPALRDTTIGKARIRKAGAQMDAGQGSKCAFGSATGCPALLLRAGNEVKDVFKDTQMRPGEEKLGCIPRA